MFAGGFEHADNITNKDMRSVRLAFQVFVQNMYGNWETLAPIVSDPIYNENVPTDLLEIDWVSEQSGSSAGNDTLVIMLDQKVSKTKLR